MRRVLLLLFAALAVFWWLGRLLGAARGRTPSRQPSPGAEPSRGRMVRDRVCNTFIPEEKAIRLRDGTEERFFCSEACRERFLADRSE